MFGFGFGFGVGIARAKLKTIFSKNGNYLVSTTGNYLTTKES